MLMALAAGKSRICCGPVTLHTETAIHIAKTLTKVSRNVPCMIQNIARIHALRQLSWFAMRLLLRLGNHEATGEVVPEPQQPPCWEFIRIFNGHGSSLSSHDLLERGWWVLGIAQIPNAPFLHWFWSWSWDKVWNPWIQVCEDRSYSGFQLLCNVSLQKLSK